MSDLNMGSGPNPKYVAAGGIAVIALGAAAFFFMGSDSKQAPATTAAAEAAVDTAAASDVAAPAPTMDPAAAPMDSAAATPAADPAIASTAADATQTTSETATTSTAAPATQVAAAPEVTAPSPSIEPTASDTAAATPAAEMEVADAQASESGVSAEDNKPRDPVAPVRPPANDALRAWWNARTSPFAVDYVGQAAESESLVIVFTMPVDPATLIDTIRITGSDGKPVEASWQSGGNSRMAIANGLSKGRYTVFIDARTHGTQSPILGTSLHGPAHIQ